MIITKDKVYGRSFVQSVDGPDYPQFSKDLGGIQYNSATLSALFAIVLSEDIFYLTGSRFFVPYPDALTPHAVYGRCAVRDYDFFVCPEDKIFGLERLRLLMKRLGLSQTKLTFSEYAQDAAHVSPLILRRQGVKEVIRFTHVPSNLQIDVQVMQDSFALARKVNLQMDPAFCTVMQDLYPQSSYPPGSPLYARDKARRTGAWLAGMSLA